MSSMSKSHQFFAACILTTASLLALAVLVSADWTALSPVSVPIVESEHPYPNNSQLLDDNEH